MVYDSPFVRFIEEEVVHPRGKGVYAYSEKHPGVVSIAMTDRDEIYLVGQWRHTIRKYSWEIPMGRMEPGEDILVAAQRELLEETNLEARQWDSIGTFYFSNGSLNQIGHVYLARDLVASAGVSDDTEDLAVKKVGMREFEEMIKNNEITDSPSIAAYFKLKLFLES